MEEQVKTKSFGASELIWDGAELEILQGIDYILMTKNSAIELRNFLNQLDLGE